MIVLDTDDKIRGDADNATEVDYTISGFVGTTATPLAGGQLAGAIGDIYTAPGDATIVSEIILVNTGAGANACNLYRLANGGSTERLIPEDCILQSGYKLATNGLITQIISTSGEVVQTYSAHKDSHDPEDGADPLDAAAPSELADVQAAGEGSSHSLARADHAHQIQHDITDDHLVTVDGSPNDNEIVRWTADGLEGLTYAELLAAIFSVALPEDLSIILDAALSGDGTWCGTETEAGIAGETLVFGECVYFKAADSRWWFTDADAEATTKPKVGFVILAAGSGGDPTKILYDGKIRADAKFPALTIGDPVFVGTTAGEIQVAAPSGAGDQVRCVGQANTANELAVNISPVWIEIGP